MPNRTLLSRAGLRLAAGVLILAALLAPRALAQESATVTVEGMAPISGGNTMAAREAALRDAMRKAVETGLPRKNNDSN